MRRVKLPKFVDIRTVPLSFWRLISAYIFSRISAYLRSRKELAAVRFGVNAVEVRLLELMLSVSR